MLQSTVCACCHAADRSGAGIGEAMRLWPLPLNSVASCLIGVVLGTLAVKLARPPPELARVLVLANAVGGSWPLIDCT